LLAGGAIILFSGGERERTMAGFQPARSGIGLTVIKSTAPVRAGAGIWNLRGLTHET